MTFRETVVALSFWSLLASSSPHAQAPSAMDGDEDGLAHVTLTLEGQQIDVAYVPDLSVYYAAHQRLLAGTAQTPVEIGTITGHRALRLGSIVPDLETTPPSLEEQERLGDDDDAERESPPTSNSYALWLNRSGDGWELQARADAEPGGDEQEHVIPLAHRLSASTDNTPMHLSASLVATASEAGKLSLHWGEHMWSTDFRFEELPPTPPRARVSGRGQTRDADSDTTAFSRGTTLAERNESVTVLPDGSRIVTLFWKGIDVEDEDYGRLGDVAEGEVVRFVRAPVLRIKTDVGLRFGETTVPTGNLAPGFAGAYGLWLRRVGDGWHFVFNDEADSWGTQYNAEFDAAEVTASYARGDGAFRPLTISVMPFGEDEGRLVVHWGPHEWTADFAIVR